MSIAAKFNKKERICSKQEFSLVLNSGSTVLFKPLKLHFTHVEKREGGQQSLVKIAVAVPKRLFAKAHDRNKIKRRIKEAYRINKDTSIYKHLNTNKDLLILIVYTSKEILSFKEIESQLVKGLEEIVRRS